MFIDYLHGKVDIDYPSYKKIILSSNPNLICIYDYLTFYFAYVWDKLGSLTISL